MPDEEELDKALHLAGNFDLIELRLLIWHATSPGDVIEVDNLAQRGKTLFTFEGKSKDQETAVKQLLQRKLSLLIHKTEYLRHGYFYPYNSTRLFYYSITRKTLIEIDSKGRKLQSFKFQDRNELAAILRNF